VVRTAQPITFSDFCQIVDMQFLTHIRRGTSISVCDFAPSSLPQDLTKALELLSITSESVCVCVGGGALHNQHHQCVGGGRVGGVEMGVGVCVGGGGGDPAAQPITFSDFCQIVDMQFLTHIRRGTSISVCDFAPSSLPQDLTKALELLSITSECVCVWGGGG
jgi:hypothetical protein